MSTNHSDGAAVVSVSSCIMIRENESLKHNKTLSARPVPQRLSPFGFLWCGCRGPFCCYCCASSPGETPRRMA